MPKVIDNYVLQDKIGSGQFGDVYKGYNQQTHQQVAIKTIKRQSIKGKFYQLLENQIKVLKTCDNPYIMKLYALKKTANHYYLILQYCNGGDMLGKVKKHKKIDENAVIKYFCQILTGFQTLVKHKIMHRDFKLANILLHDDNIKIADFGFSKLLNTQDYTTTMLGSPLNMAPQVLGGNKYNNKADIWSIGACIYEMLFGKPPYMANNMVDLLKNINTKPLTFPNDIKINSVLMDVIKKMLTPDVKKRIGWNDLFTHPINRYLDNQIRQQIDLQLIQDESLMLNTSKFYLKKNLVMQKPEDIEQKAKMNNQLIKIIETGEKNHQTKNEITQKQNPSKVQEKKTFTRKVQNPSQIKTQEQKTQNNSLNTEEQPKKWKNSSKHNQKQVSSPDFSHVHRFNSKLILYYRNIYAYFASVVDQIIQLSQQDSDLTAYILISKILYMINWIQIQLQSEKPSINGVQRWSEYKIQTEYIQIRDYIQKQENVFSIFKDSLESTIKQKLLKGLIQGEDIRNLIIQKKQSKNQYKQFRSLFTKYLFDYTKKLIKNITHQTLCTKDFEFTKKKWKHVENVLICLNYQQQFKVWRLISQGDNKKYIKQNESQMKDCFNFTKFYEDKTNQTNQETLLKIQKLLLTK